MSSVVDRLMRMTVTVTSPDGLLRARCDSERNARFKFRDETDFEHYEPAELSRQLGALLRALALGRNDGIRAAYRADARAETGPDEPHWDAGVRRFREALNRIRPVGVSDTGLISLTSNLGLDDYRVTLDLDRLRRTDAGEFIRELTGAHRDLLIDRRVQRSELTRRHLAH